MKKQKRFRSDALRSAARGRTCVLCDRAIVHPTTETTVLAHLPGMYYGMPAGISQKTHDWLGAHLCAKHHEKMDNEWRKDTQMRMMALCLTLQRLFDSGTITIDGEKHEAS